MAHYDVTALLAALPAETRIAVEVGALAKAAFADALESALLECVHDLGIPFRRNDRVLFELGGIGVTGA